MRDRSPCIACKHRSPGCQSRCELGRKYFKKQAEERDRVNSERRKDKTFDSFKSERVYESKKRAGVL
jgi:hypothetical protein